MRRHLGFTVAEVDAMPWWQHRMYMDGITEEFSDEESGGEVDVGDGLAGLGVTVREA